MTNQQLSSYIKEQLEQGKTKDGIKSELLGAGWQEADINQALNIPGSSIPPKPPSPTPSFAPIGQQNLDPKAVWIFFLRWALVFLFFPIWMIIVVAGSLTMSGLGFLGIGLFALIALIIAFIWAKLSYRFYHFELTEEGFRKEFGVILKKYTTIPYDRIQNVDIYRGILDRILGLSDLHIQTAGMSVSAGRFGGGSSEGRLPGLSQEDAENLRNELIHRARQNRNQGL